MDAVGAAVVDSVADVTVPFMLCDGMIDADAAAVDALDMMLEMTEEADAAAELAAALALDFALAMADEAG